MPPSIVQKLDDGNLWEVFWIVKQRSFEIGAKNEIRHLVDVAQWTYGAWRRVACLLPALHSYDMQFCCTAVMLFKT
jgi:hypothetical protein